MKRLAVMCLACMSLLAVPARTVSTGTVVANPGATVSVPVNVDDVADVGAAVFVVGYDPTIVVCLGVDAGEAVEAKSLTYLDSGSGRICAIVSGFRQRQGNVMRLRFSLRDGTQGLFSDVTLQDVQLGASDGVTDLSASNPLKVVNGMIRVQPCDAKTARLEEPFVVHAKTELRSLVLGAGDGLGASADGEGIVVSESVASQGAIPVEPPLGGWRTGSYALLTTPTQGLSFELKAATNVLFRTTNDARGVTYWADVTIEGQVEIAHEDGLLSTAALAQVRTALADELAEHPEVTSVVVKGAAALVPVVVDLGIAPLFEVQGTQAVATYMEPTLRITEFNPETGRVRIRVTPGAGNSIRSTLTTGCIHVYGTSDLTRRMQYIPGTGFDLTPYLREETKGEANLSVSLGTHTFIKIKAETTNKHQGEIE